MVGRPLPLGVERQLGGGGNSGPYLVLQGSGSSDLGGMTGTVLTRKMGD
jgi:hypothetical protein